MTQSDAPGKADASDIYANPLRHAMKSLRAKIEEIDRLKAVNAELLAALDTMVKRYTTLVSSGDCGHWDCEQEEEVIAARAAIAKAQS